MNSYLPDELHRACILFYVKHRIEQISFMCKLRGFTYNKEKYHIEVSDYYDYLGEKSLLTLTYKGTPVVTCKPLRDIQFTDAGYDSDDWLEPLHRVYELGCEYDKKRQAADEQKNKFENKIKKIGTLFDKLRGS